MVASVLFSVCVLVVAAKLFLLGMREAWGLSKLICYSVLFPITLLMLMGSGLMAVALPLMVLEVMASIVTI